MTRLQKPADVFISHSSEDASVALSLCELLEKQGTRCWIAPRDVPVGSHFAEEVLSAIEETRATIVLLSENSNRSTHVRNEIERAVAKGKPVLPVRIRNVLPARPLELYLSASQWVDAWTPPLAQWAQQIAAALDALVPKQTDLSNAAGLRVGVVAVGGGAIRATEHLLSSSASALHLVAVNSDGSSLDSCRLPVKVHLRAGLVQGKSAGGDPKIGRTAALEAVDSIRAALTGLDLAFVVTCLGGGTGTGASPVVCALAREVGTLTICVASTPFRMEGSRRVGVANQGVKDLAEVADSLVMVSNQDLLERGVPVNKSFSRSDEAIAGVVRAVSDLLLVPGLVNVDLEDVRQIFREGGFGGVGIGVGSGDDSAVLAAKRAIASPMLSQGRIREARSLLLNVTAGASLTLLSVSEAVEVIQQEGSADAIVVFGAVVDESIKDETVHVTLVAMGLQGPLVGS
jgi:cell division protein FtsZ